MSEISPKMSDTNTPKNLQISIPDKIPQTQLSPEKDKSMSNNPRSVSTSRFFCQLTSAVHCTAVYSKISEVHSVWWRGLDPLLRLSCNYHNDFYLFYCRSEQLQAIPTSNLQDK